MYLVGFRSLAPFAVTLEVSNDEKSVHRESYCAHLCSLSIMNQSPTQWSATNYQNQPHQQRSNDIGYTQNGMGYRNHNESDHGESTLCIMLTLYITELTHFTWNGDWNMGELRG